MKNPYRNTIFVKSIKVLEVKELLKKCPKDVQNYVEELERVLEKQKELTTKAIAKIRELSAK